jgi:indolepyruvate ferredoxin oxidoreductase, alpha subunit
MDGGSPRKDGAKGMERSFAGEVGKLTLGANQVFHGETILAVTKALLQSGISYVGGYPGAPMSHLMDVLADASDEILEPYGIHFEQSASEAGAAALLGASIHYPLRGAVTWKSVVGTNVASDALSNVASAGVTGGAVIVVGEDYGEGASIIQERSHAAAMKSSLPLIDPRYHLPTIVELTEKSFELSEACHLPVMLSLRIRACHMTGSFVCKDNQTPTYSARNPFPEARYDVGKIVLPPATYAQEKAKFEDRLPAARRFIADNNLNEVMGDETGTHGIITQGGTYSVVMRALRLLGAADAFGNTDIPILVLNVIHPLVPEQIESFLAGKDSVLVVEEGNPNFIENQVAAIAQGARIDCRVHGKDVLPMAGEYVADVTRQGIAAYLGGAASSCARPGITVKASAIEAEAAAARKHLADALPRPMPPRPPTFCTGCPERPVFTALKLLMQERGPIHISMDIGCTTFATLPPFNVGSTVLGYGMSLASGGAVGPSLGQPTVAVMGDGGFWHNGLATGVVNAQWNALDAVLVIVENGYASATGQHHLPSTGATPRGVPSNVSIEGALRGVGVSWIEKVDSYDLADTLDGLRKALDAPGKGLRVVISDNECMLARQRREKPAKAKARAAGKSVEISRFGVDAEVCTGDHSCMRLNGCPSLTLKPSTDPLKESPVAHVENDCVACGHCGETAAAARLCPSFYRADAVINPNLWQRATAAVNDGLLRLMGAS